MLWYKRLGHVSIPKICRSLTGEVIHRVPLIKQSINNFCYECPVGKQAKASHKCRDHNISNQLLELLHLDLMGPMQVESFGGKRYVFVIVDDYSRFTWVRFIREKSDTFKVFRSLFF